MGNVSEKEKQQHHRWVANYFRGKIDEFSYRLEETVSACDISLSCAKAGKNHPEETGKAVTYGFSALSNLVQTLKDSASTFLHPPIPWGSIKSLRHGTFFYLSRNAATHDGNPIISCWMEGCFYIPSDIRRLNDAERLVVIPAPTEDVRALCLEFSADFMNLLVERLSTMERGPFLLGTSYDINEVATFMESRVVPQAAKDLFAQDSERIRTAVQACRFDPIEDSISKLNAVRRRCEEQLLG